MFYKLRSDYVLRGWKGRAWELVQRPANTVRHLSQSEFQMLMLCDGETDIKEEMLSDPMQKALRQYEEMGAVEACECAQPIDSDQTYRYFDNRAVEKIMWSVTGKCNFCCRHCYMDAPEGALGEISTEEALDLIDQMAGCGVLRVDITGGEPFVRKDFWLLIDRLLSHKIAIGTIYTNGWLINEALLDAFERRKIKPDISVSFDGVGWHDWMRGVSGAEEVTLRALRLCEERGFHTDVEMCIHRGSQNMLFQTIETLRSAGVKQMKVGNIAMTDLWRRHSEGYEWTVREYMEQMIRCIPQYYEAGCPVETLILSGVIALYSDRPYRTIPDVYDDTEKEADRYLCGHARWHCYITPEGRLLPCMPLTAVPEQKLFPKVRDIGLKKGLNDSFYMQFVSERVRDLLNVNEECASCRYRYPCGGGCRANALMEECHNLMGCDRTACMLWKEGYVERIRRTAEAAYAEHKRKEGSKNVC